jgi:alpha-beta hydrolase superfamily lysophospholipase
VGNNLDNFDNLARNAQNLQNEANGGGDVATIAWLGYKPPSSPPSDWDAASAAKAEHAGDRLKSFVESLPGRRDRSLSLIGHSYGSLVVANALQRGTTVTNAVFLGSPGLDEDLGQLAAKTKLFSLAAVGDPIVWAGEKSRWYGLPPSDYRASNQVTRLCAEDSTGHSEYYRLRTQSLRNLGALVNGWYDAVTPYDFTQRGGGCL